MEIHLWAIIVLLAIYCGLIAVILGLLDKLDRVRRDKAKEPMGDRGGGIDPRD
jgi:hypothetical protein